MIIDNKITANKVIADPEFTKSTPPSVTAATGMDAITHAVESYISNMATPLTEYHSLKSLQIFHKNLLLAVKDGSDMAAREQMMLGSYRTELWFFQCQFGTGARDCSYVKRAFSSRAWYGKRGSTSLCYGI